MAEDTQEKTCPTLLQQLVARATQPFSAFVLGVAAGTGGPEVADLIRKVLGF